MVSPSLILDFGFWIEDKDDGEEAGAKAFKLFARPWHASAERLADFRIRSGQVAGSATDAAACLLFGECRDGDEEQSRPNFRRAPE